MQVDQTGLLISLVLLAVLQGPVFLQQLALLQGFDLDAMEPVRAAITCL